MFRRSQRVRPPAGDEPTRDQPQERFTYIHQGTVFTGDVKADGRVRVHGTILGDIEVDGLLEVAEHGVVDGASIVAGSLVVLGRVRGTVRVSGKVEVWKGGVLEGDVRAGSLDIEDGATFVGRSEMALPTGPPRLGAPSETPSDTIEAVEPPGASGAAPTVDEAAVQGGVDGGDAASAARGRGGV